MTKILCVTKKCGGVVDADLSQVERSREGHWQFQCPDCNYWNLAIADGAVQATSKTPFELDRLPPSLRALGPVKRSPPGGV